MNNATCNKCGWVHFEVSREYAVNQVADFNKFYDGLDEKGKSCYGGHSSIKSYEKCFHCGNHYKDFRDSLPNDCPAGCTIQPIIDRRD